MEDKLRLGFYHFDPRWCSRKMFDDVLDRGFINSVTLSMDSYGTAAYGCERVREKGGEVWLGAPIFYRKKESLSEYMKRTDNYINYLKNDGHWDIVAGFHWDEPLGGGGSDNKDFHDVTKALWEEYGKRNFPVWSLQELRGFKTGNPDDPEEFKVLEPEATEYMTDTGFDVYGYDFREINKRLRYQLDLCSESLGVPIENTMDMMKAYTDIMMKKMVNEDTKVWYFPCSYNCGSWSGGSTDEDYCISHLENFKNLLLEQKHPGGLIGYTFKSWLRNQRGLDFHLDRSSPEYWGKYEEALKKVYNELQNSNINN